MDHFKGSNALEWALSGTFHEKCLNKKHFPKVNSLEQSTTSHAKLRVSQKYMEFKAEAPAIGYSGVE